MNVGVVIFLGFVALALLWMMLHETKPVVKRRKCEKQPDKDCTYVIEYGPGMAIRASGHFGCCKIIDQMKGMNATFCKMEPGVDYNGTSITPGFKKQVTDAKKMYDKIDSSGPRY